MTRTLIILIFFLATLTFCNSQQEVDKVVKQFKWTKGIEPQNKYQYNIALATTDKVFVIGGYKNGGAFEMYQTLSDHWKTLPPLPIPRCFISGAILDNSIYVIGGIDDSNKYSSAVEKYDLTLNKWIACEEIAAARSRLASVSLNGKIYVLGGHERTDDKHFKNSAAVEQYDPMTNSWTRKADMPTPRHGHSAIAINNKILVVGGYTDAGPTNIVEEYDPHTDKWKTKSEMPTPRGFFGLVTLGNYMYAIAGRVRQKNGPIEQYDYKNDLWTQLEPLPERINRFGITLFDNKVYIIGGEECPKGMLIGELKK